MNVEEIMQYCESYDYVTSDYPFGEYPKCYRIGNKIFAEVYPDGVQGALKILLEDESIPKETKCPMITLRCDQMFGDAMKQGYKQSALRPYHCPPMQQPYAITVLLEHDIPDQVIKDMIDHSYMVVFHKLTKKKQKELEESKLPSL